MTPEGARLASRGLRRAVSLAMALTAAAALMPGTAAITSALGPPVSISIVDAPRVPSKSGYKPASRKIAPGTWVTWSNDGQDAHTVTAADGSFDSGNLDPSEGFSWYFDQPGTFIYLCSLHPWMTGAIVVGGQVPDVAPPADTGDQSSSGVSGSSG
jgi:plastocyanin